MSVYLITGASGYIGSMLAKRLLETESDSEVIALGRSRARLEERFFNGGGRQKRSSWDNRLRLIQADLCDENFVEQIFPEIDQMDYVLHCASVTTSSEMVVHPVEVTESIVRGTQNVLKLVLRYSIKSMVYLSSMEVYGDIDCSDGHLVTEEEVAEGRLDILRTRSCYPLGKRMAENICCSYWKEYAVPVKIARLAQTFGRGILLSDNRVFAQFARSVEAGKNIILHTEGRSMGNYCAIDDAIAGILTILEKGENGGAYNVVNEENTMTIRQMAELVASLDRTGRTKVCFDILTDGGHGYAADTGLRLSGEKLRTLGWKPQKNLRDMYRELLLEMNSES